MEPWKPVNCSASWWPAMNHEAMAARALACKLLASTEDYEALRDRAIPSNCWQALETMKPLKPLCSAPYRLSLLCYAMSRAHKSH